MNVIIRIDYVVYDNRVTRSGSFPLKRRKPEQVALDWIRHIERKIYPIEEIERVLADGEDITEKVMELKKAPLN